MSVACLVAAGTIAAAAIWDHTHPAPTPQREWVSLWYCGHYGRRCGDTDPWDVGWHRRERLYQDGLAGSLTAGLLFALAARSRRRALAGGRVPVDEPSAGTSTPSSWRIRS